MATLVLSLTSLRSEINRLCPDRSKTSDGWIGDEAHQQEPSDHNPDSRGLVHAIDVDKDLNLYGLTMAMLVAFIVGRCRANKERRLRYVIHNRMIWSASNGWRGRPYTGKNPHTEHAHFSASYDPTLEASPVSWHLEEIPVSLTPADRALLIEVRDLIKALPVAVWNHTEPDPDTSVAKPLPPRRVGGDMRWLDKRARAYRDQIMTAIHTRFTDQ